MLQNCFADELLDSSAESYMVALPRTHDISQVTWTNNHLSPLYNQIESENTTPGIPATYNHVYATPQLRDLLLPAQADVAATKRENETDSSSEIPPMYNHTSPLYNHTQLRDLLMTSRAASSSAHIESETLSSLSTSEITPAPTFGTLRNDVTAVTSHPVMTSPVGVANIRVKLCNAKLWQQFDACTNEMIITKAGRQDNFIYLFLIVGDVIIISIMSVATNLL